MVGNTLIANTICCWTELIQFGVLTNYQRTAIINIRYIPNLENLIVYNTQINCLQQNYETIWLFVIIMSFFLNLPIGKIWHVIENNVYLQHYVLNLIARNLLWKKALYYLYE